MTTRGGILLPRPYQYDWEVMNLNPFPVTYLTCGAASTITIHTRVPHNDAIVDFDEFMYFVRIVGGGSVTHDIKITNLRTSQVLDTVQRVEGNSSWTARVFAMATDFPFLPGDPIKVEIIHVSGTAGSVVQLRTRYKGSYFTDAVNVGATFPLATDTVSSPRFHSPGIFITWQDSDTNVIAQFMPGLMPEKSRGQIPSLADRNFNGNLFEMPLSDRQPSGLWVYCSPAPATAATTVRLMAEPADVFDRTEIWNQDITLQLIRSFQYAPFDGTQPILEQGEKYIIGLDQDSSSGHHGLITHEWIDDKAAVQLGWDDLTTFYSWSTTSSAWQILVPRLHLELGLVFEEE